MTTFHVLIMLMMLSLNPGVKAGCKPNGCSVWSIVPYKYFFSRACNKHDVCYGCGVDYGWRRPVCDLAFKRDMYKLCKSSAVEWWCKSWAWIYYKAVRYFGGRRYHWSSLSWCTNCPKSHGDPRKVLK